MREWIDPYNPFNSMKVLFWREHLEGCTSGDFLPPVVVNWDLVLGCNYKCKHCIWVKRQSYEPTMVPFEIAKTVPEFLFNWGVKAVCLAGEWGDPSLYPELGEILRLLHYWNLDVGLVSNGLAYTNDDLEAAAHYTRFTGFSIDAGNPRAYAAVHNAHSQNFSIVLKNVERLCRFARSRNLPVEVGYKFLVFPESYDTIYEGAKLAKDMGCRDFQCRPAWLPPEETATINVAVANEQMERALELEDENFRVSTVRHKFTGEFLKKTPDHCYATPLTSTWCANGEVHLCVDRRDMKDILVNYLERGLQAVKYLWNSEVHRASIANLNRDLVHCKRCTMFEYNQAIKKCIVNDGMDRRLI